MNFNDMHEPLTTVTISTTNLPQQLLQMRVNLQPYPGCQESILNVSVKEVKHDADGVMLTIDPRDSDGLPILKTPDCCHQDDRSNIDLA